MLLTQPRTKGALVISLDFELHWGVRDVHSINGPYRANLMGARSAIPKMLDLFESAGLAATWATVGFLFARTRSELGNFSPTDRPRYSEGHLDPYVEEIGADEEDDPLHFAPSLIEAIASTPRQEVGSHTFSHFYCLEEGQSKEQFATDLESATAIAQERGIQLRSLAFPRNQVNPNYLDVVKEFGFVAYRGNQPRWMYEVSRGGPSTYLQRAGRLADSYVGLGGSHVTPWDAVIDSNGLCDIPASMFLRPYDPRTRSLEALRVRRITTAMTRAAREGGIFHLWWHPHNFGIHTDENLAVVTRIAEHFAELNDRFSFRSMTMFEASSEARANR
jgi:peptidoglycan/xylan/chitin deacetylase (PgdA/CDA1 family)